MGAPSPPPAPDPGRTAAAQGAMNRSTAAVQQNMNMVDQIGPQGSARYSQAGTTQTWIEPAFDDKGRQIEGTGRFVDTPKFQLETTLTPEGQRIFNTNQQTQQNIATIGRDQSARIGGLLAQPLNLNNEAVEGRLLDLGRRRLDPIMAEREDALRTRLVGQGLAPGSRAWDAEMRRFQEGRNDATNQLLLTGRGQAIQEALTERNQPINEITALMSGSQVQMPQMQSTPQAGVAAPDYQGAVRDKHNADMQAWQAQAQSQNQLFGGLLSLGGMLGGGFLRSDKDAKENIEKVGKLDNGLNVYAYNYKGDETPRIGLLAQEVKKTKPEAVKRIGGLLAVNYGEAVKKKGKAA